MRAHTKVDGLWCEQGPGVCRRTRRHTGAAAAAAAAAPPPAHSLVRRVLPPRGRALYVRLLHVLREVGVAAGRERRDGGGGQAARLLVGDRERGPRLHERGLGEGALRARGWRAEG